VLRRMQTMLSGYRVLGRVLLLFLPDEALFCGAIRFRLDGEGFSHVAEGPGVGAAADWECISSRTTQYHRYRRSK
jgi:hypothetical protein